jgi:uncharacterized iron-regulated membrane protein
VDVTTAREIAAALVLFGTTGTASLTIYQLVLRSSDVLLLPTSVTARVRWWRAHLAAAMVLSACLLLLGVLGLVLL